MKACLDRLQMRYSGPRRTHNAAKLSPQVPYCVMHSATGIPAGARIKLSLAEEDSIGRRDRGRPYLYICNECWTNIMETRQAFELSLDNPKDSEHV